MDVIRPAILTFCRVRKQYHCIALEHERDLPSLPCTDIDSFFVPLVQPHNPSRDFLCDGSCRLGDTGPPDQARIVRAGRERIEDFGGEQASAAGRAQELIVLDPFEI
ncbi:hypothetical protein Tco_1408026 [Tanacetum coccineum]